MSDILKGLFGFALSILVIYCVYWVTKHGGYFFFYESMVIETIKETVKPEYLIK